MCGSFLYIGLAHAIVHATLLLLLRVLVWVARTSALLNIVIRSQTALFKTDASDGSTSMVTRPELNVRSRSVAQVIVKAKEVKAGTTTTRLTA